MEQAPTGERRATPATDDGPHRNIGRAGERGAGVVEWLGISALSIAMLATIFAALNSVGLDLVDYIRATLGL